MVFTVRAVGLSHRNNNRVNPLAAGVNPVPRVADGSILPALNNY
jgi:hypothetical protein